MLGSSPNVQNLVSKIFAKHCKRFGFKSLMSRPGLGTFKSRFRLEFLLKISVSQRQCLGLEDFGRDSSSGCYLLYKVGYIVKERITLSAATGTSPTMSIAQRTYYPHSLGRLR